MAPAPVAIEPLTKSGHYRHMAKRDAAVWERFLDKHGGFYAAVAYDVALGGVQLQTQDDDPGLTDAWRYATALKVDAMLFTPTHVVIAEVRPYATVSAFGAALGYTLLAQREQLTTLPIQPAIICEAIQPDVRWLCSELAVLIFEV
jgi:hypothetical protein